jgi:hypothetical protein
MDDTFEPARRELCPDNACIGLIGPDGRCKVCGQVSPSAVADPRHRGMISPAGDNDGDGEPFDGDRELCPDGACIGLIGPDRRCTECGTEAPARAPGDPAPAASSPAGGAEEASSPSATAAGRPAGEALEVEDDQDRELCPDGTCIGLIGPDSRCKVCGTPREASPS